MSALFEPFTLRSLTIPNRVWMAPMCQYSAAPEGPADRRARRLALRALRRARGRRHRPDPHRGHRGEPRGPDQPVRPRHLERHPDRGLPPHHPLPQRARAPCPASSSPTPAARPPPTAPGRAARRSARTAVRLAAGRARARCRSTRGTRSPTELTVDADRGDRRAVRGRGPPGPGRRLRGRRDPRRARLPDQRVPLPAHQPPHRRVRRLVREPRPASRWRSSTPYGRCGPTNCRSSSASRPPTGWRTAAGPPTTPSASPRELQAHGVDLLDVSTRRQRRRARRIPTGPGYQVPFAARVKAETGLAGRRGRPDHRGPSRPRRSSPTARPTPSCSAANCCATPASRGTRRGNSAGRSPCRTSTTGPSEAVRKGVRDPRRSGAAPSDLHGHVPGRRCQWRGADWPLSETTTSRRCSGMTDVLLAVGTRKGLFIGRGGAAAHGSSTARISTRRPCTRSRSTPAGPRPGCWPAATARTGARRCSTPTTSAGPGPSPPSPAVKFPQGHRGLAGAGLAAASGRPRRTRTWCTRARNRPRCSAPRTAARPSSSYGRCGSTRPARKWVPGGGGEGRAHGGHRPAGPATR